MRGLKRNPVEKRENLQDYFWNLKQKAKESLEELKKNKNQKIKYLLK